jgi:hypothetical protein
VLGIIKFNCIIIIIVRTYIYTTYVYSVYAHNGWTGALVISLHSLLYVCRYVARGVRGPRNQCHLKIKRIDRRGKRQAAWRGVSSRPCRVMVQAGGVTLLSDPCFLAVSHLSITKFIDHFPSIHPTVLHYYHCYDWDGHNNRQAEAEPEAAKQASDKQRHARAHTAPHRTRTATQKQRRVRSTPFCFIYIPVYILPNNPLSVLYYSTKDRRNVEKVDRYTGCYKSDLELITVRRSITTLYSGQLVVRCKNL